MKKITTVVLFFLLFDAYVNAQNWNAVGAGVNNDGVFALLPYDSVLYVGGLFDSAGGNLSRGIAEWNGNSWSSLGIGLGPGGGYGVNTLVIYRGKLYVAGGFDSAGGKPAKNIAAWDGKNWSSLGSGTNGYINSLAVYNGCLYVAGGFNIAGGVTAWGIAKWNDTVWSNVGSGGVSGNAFCLEVYKGNLYLGGAIDSVGHIHVHGIAKWDGIKWDSLSSNNWNCTFSCLYADDSILYGGGGGGFGSGEINFLGQWNGSNWDSVPDTKNNVNLPVNAITSDNGMVYAGGWFDSIGGVFTPSIAMWDGKKWYPMGAGIKALSTGVEAIAEFDSSIYVGGSFNYSGSSSVQLHNIARWGMGSPLSLKKLIPSIDVEIFPNPSNGIFNIQLSGSNGHPDNYRESVEVYNMLGERVYVAFLPQTPKGALSSIDLTNQPSGIYLYRVTSETGNVIGTGKIIIQK